MNGSALRKILPALSVISMLGFLAQSARADVADLSSLLEKIPTGVITQALDNLSLQTSATLLSTNISKGLNLNLHYSYKEYPAFRDSLYTRVDEWQLGDTLSPLSWTKALGSAIFVDIQPATQIIYVRQFPTERQAILALPDIANPFGLKNVPVTADNVIKHMTAGDAVMLPVTLNLLLGVQAVQTLGLFQLTEPVEVVASGQYQIAVIRLPDNRVRMRIIATKSKGVNTQPNAQFAGLQVFKLNLLNKGLDQIIGTNLLQETWAKTGGEFFVVDYMFNLNDADARKAYDSILASNFTLRALDELRKAGNISDNKVHVISDLTQAEKLAVADAALPMEQKRVAQILQATDDYSQTSNDFNSNFHLIGFDLATSKTNHSVTFYDSNKKRSDYQLPIYIKSSDWNAVFGLIDNSNAYTGSTLYDSTDPKSPTFSDEIITLELKNKILGSSKRKQISKTLALMIPPTILNQVDFSMWNTDDSVLQARVFAQVIFKREALEALTGITKAEIQSRLETYLTAQGLKSLIPHEVPKIVLDDDTRQWVERGTFMSNPDTTDFEDELAYILDPSHDVNSRMDRFSQLRTNSVFVKAGSGFVFDLLQDHLNGIDLNKLVYVQIQLDGYGQKPVRFSYGDSLSNQVYAAMEYIQNVIDNGTFDLRLQTFGAPFSL